MQGGFHATHQLGGADALLGDILQTAALGVLRHIRAPKSALAMHQPPLQPLRPRPVPPAQLAVVVRGGGG
eukprot:7129918-Pyramimonas_sp.AAC.1